MVVSDIAEFPMLTLVMVSFLVVTAATGIGFLAWLPRSTYEATLGH